MNEIRRLRKLAGLKEDMAINVPEYSEGDLVHPRWAQDGAPYKVVGRTNTGKYIVVDDLGKKGSISGDDIVFAKVAEEITADDIDAAQNDIDLDTGSQFMEKAQVVSCNQDNPSSVVDACAMDTSTVVNEELGPDSPVFAQTLSRVEQLDNGMLDIEQAFLIVDKELAAQGYDELERERICTWVERVINHNNQSFDDSAMDMQNPNEGMEIMTDKTNDSASLEEKAYGLDNGYSDQETLDGQDYFPTGADSPVTSKVGPSGARQGDNPEQKKMEVTETHKELVYNYRKFLKESASKK